MSEFNELNTGAAHIMRHTTQYEECRDIEIKTMNSNPFAFGDAEDVKIERFCSMISHSVSAPFPRSQVQLAYAVSGIKKGLKALSRFEMIERHPVVPKSSCDGERLDIKPLKKLDELLNQPLAIQAFPTLWQVVRFMHEQDQEEIYQILALKFNFFNL